MSDGLNNTEQWLLRIIKDSRTLVYKAHALLRAIYTCYATHSVALRGVRVRANDIVCHDHGNCRYLEYGIRVEHITTYFLSIA